MGEPLTYYDGKSFTWSFRKLMGFTDNSNNTVSYTYDCDGIRTSKTVNNVTTQYLLSGSTILQETAPNKTIIYEYDESGYLRGMVYNGSRYVYIRNGTDDIIGILDPSGSLAARYDYDAFGQCTVTNYNGSTIGNINPFRYRSYYYDTESGFYYLNARYYDPNTRRFISTDEFEYLGSSDSIISYNLFVYCSNNPLNRVDPDGTISVSITFAFLIGLSNVVTNAVLLSITRQKYSALDMLLDFTASFVGTFIKSKILSFILGGLPSLVSSLLKGESALRSLKNGLISAMVSKLSVNEKLSDILANSHVLLRVFVVDVFDFMVSTVNAVIGVVRETPLKRLTKYHAVKKGVTNKLKWFRRKYKY